MTFFRRLVLLLAVFACVGVPVVLAQGPEATNEFRPIQPGDLVQEQLPAAPLVFAAYAFVWVTFVVYLFVLWQRLRKVEAELSEVRARMGGARR